MSISRVQAAIDDMQDKVECVEVRVQDTGDEAEEADKDISQLSTAKSEGWQQEVAGLKEKAAALRVEKQQLREEEAVLRRKKALLMEQKLRLMRSQMWPAGSG
jgi:hypothetical protein